MMRIILLGLFICSNVACASTKINNENLASSSDYQEHIRMLEKVDRIR